MFLLYGKLPFQDHFQTGLQPVRGSIDHVRVQFGRRDKGIVVDAIIEIGIFAVSDFRLAAIAVFVN